MFGIVETPLRDVAAVVELEEEVAGDSEREEVDRRAADDLVGPQVNREVGVDQRERSTGGHPDEQAHDPAAALVGAPDAPERTHQHHPLEADVDDPAALGEHPADRAEDERRRKRECLGEQRRR